jgi:hypothetical protein
MVVVETPRSVYVAELTTNVLYGMYLAHFPLIKVLKSQERMAEAETRGNAIGTKSAAVIGVVRLDWSAYLPLRDHVP